MLKATVKIKHNINIGTFNKVVAFLKKKSVGYKPKKSKTLSREEIVKFIIDAPDLQYLMNKVALVVGIAGACRRDELTKITLDDIKDRGDVLVITIPDTKNHIPRTFTITSNMTNDINPIAIFKKYIALRPVHITHQRLFICYRNGKCTVQAVGKNTFAHIPAKIASYLKLDSPKLYTGHCFRRTSASLLADSGADISSIKRHGGWKSTTVAEAYIEDSEFNKLQTANKILVGEINGASTSSAAALQTDSIILPGKKPNDHFPANVNFQANNTDLSTKFTVNAETPGIVINNSASGIINIHYSK